MPSASLHSICGRIIHKLRPQDSIRYHTLFNPSYRRRKDVALGTESRRSRLRLSNQPRAWSAVAMEHTAYAKKPEKVVYLGEIEFHTTGQMIVEAFGCEGGNLLVLLAVKDE